MKKKPMVKASEKLTKPTYFERSTRFIPEKYFISAKQSIQGKEVKDCDGLSSLAFHLTPMPFKILSTT